MGRTTRKTGPLSNADKDYIRKNVDNMTSAHMAEILNRTLEPIDLFISKERIGKQYEMGQEEKKSEKKVLEELKTRPFYNDLKSMFTEREVKYFIEYWIFAVLEFGGDILPTEELELKEYLTYDVLKTRLLIDAKRAKMEKDEFRRKLRQEMEKNERYRDEAKMKFYKIEIATCDKDIIEYNRNFKDLSEKADKIKRALKSTREERTRHLEKSGVDIKQWVISLQDYYNRKRQGREMEILKMAKDKAISDLSEYMTYADGEVDRPILNADSIEYENN